MGCYLFDQIKFSEYSHLYKLVNEYYNFDNFYFAFLMVFRVTSGESWPLIMLEYSKINNNLVGDYVAYVYFIATVFICDIIMLNLFVLVVLQQYDEFHSKEENPIQSFEELIANFKEVWNKYSLPKDNGERIKNIHITELLIKLKGDLKIEYYEELKKKETSLQENVVKEKTKKEILELKFTM